MNKPNPTKRICFYFGLFTSRFNGEPFVGFGTSEAGFLIPLHINQSDTSEALAPGAVDKRLSGLTAMIPVAGQTMRATHNTHGCIAGNMATQGHQDMSGAFGRVRNVYGIRPVLAYDSPAIVRMDENHGEPCALNGYSIQTFHQGR